ncbi:IS91 family transposase [Verrucomicrobiota bacterium sgz303538]
MTKESRTGGGSGAKPACKLADVLRDGLGQASAATLPLGAHQRKVLGTLLACRTEAAGGHRFRCTDCEKEFFVPHRCGNRHCPQCQGREAAQWLLRQSASVLPVPYFHMVFTLPHALNPLIRQNQAALYALLFSAASSTLLDFARERFGGVPGITAVLHTWSQTLAEHYHLHCIVTAGAMSDDQTRWIKGNPRYLFAVKALSKVFRARMCDGIHALFREGKLQFHGIMADYEDPLAFEHWLAPAVRRKWVVYSKRPFAGPQQVLGYLSRYTHRVAIGNARLLHLDAEEHTIRFRYKDYANHGQREEMELPTPEFVRRFCLHVLPKGFQKIRHFGLLSNRNRKEKIATARVLLNQARPDVIPASVCILPLLLPGALIEPQQPPPPRCPCCGSERVSHLGEKPRRIVPVCLPFPDSS